MRTITAAERALTVSLIIALFVLMLLEVIARYVFDSPLRWSAELARFALVGAVFLGSTFTMSEDSHLQVDVTAGRASPRLERRLGVISAIITASISALIAVAGVQYIQATSGRRAPSTGLSLNWPNGVITGAFVLMCVHSALKAFNLIKRNGEHRARTTTP